MILQPSVVQCYQHKLYIVMKNRARGVKQNVSLKLDVPAWLIEQVGKLCPLSALNVACMLLV